MRGVVSNVLHDNYVIRGVTETLRRLVSNRRTLVPMLYLTFICLLALVGPYITPYHYSETVIAADGTLKQAAPPSLENPLGTTYQANDILSRIVYGARPTVITGLLGGTMIITIGMSIGVTAGYVGGRVDDLLMRVTDVAYSLPLIPFALVLVGLFGVGFIQSIVVIGFILWRGNARVLRSQVLQIKERPYVLSAKATGASTPYIMIKHIVPNIAAMAFLFFALGVGFTIILQAGLAFLGVSNPFIPSWGVMLRNAYRSGYMASQPTWSIIPGLLISFTVISTFLVGREVETSETSEEAITQGGG